MGDAPYIELKERTVNTFAFHIRLKPGAGAAYDRLHNPVPTAVTDQLRRATVERYRIFRDGDHLFGCYDVDQIDTFAHVMAEPPRESEHRIWFDTVRSLFVDFVVNDELGSFEPLPCVFSFIPEGE